VAAIIVVYMHRTRGVTIATETAHRY